MDIFLVTCARDIKLLRHFFLSCELFFKATGAIHCFVWKRERRLLEQIDIPDNVTVWWKDDVSNSSQTISGINYILSLYPTDMSIPIGSGLSILIF
jgi:hypothetical protein